MHLKTLLEKTFNEHLARPKTFMYYVEHEKHCLKYYKDLYVEVKSISAFLNNNIAITRKFCYVGICVKNNILCLPTLILGCLQEEIPIVYIDIENHIEFNKHLIEHLHITSLILDEQSEGFINVLKSPRLIEQFSIWDVKLQLWETGEVFSEVTDTPVMLYAMQTSGSTGTPKIVQVPEQAILPNILDLRSLWSVTEDDVILLASPPTFDPFMVELLLAATSGAALLLVSPELRLSPNHLLDTVFSLHSPVHITIAQLTPSIFTRWSIQQIRTRILAKDSALRVLALGGDKFPPTWWWQKCRAECNQTQLYNLYGTTEVSCWATVGSGTDGGLGSPLSETELRVVDDAGHTVTNGIGEMYIGSNTRICLMENETWQQLKHPVFRATGDLVAVKNNNYEYIGRKDNVVKRWGHRVSLDTVEAVSVEHSDVTAACCVLHSDILALYICLRQGSVVDSVKDSLKQTLLKRLNKASVPDVVLVLKELPINRHGKTNKNKLKSMLTDMKNDELFKNPIDLFKYLWKKYTCGSMTEDSAFLSVGGNSVAAMLMVNSLALQGYELSMTVLSHMLNNGTLSECCRLIESRSESQSPTIDTKIGLKPDEHVSKNIKISNTSDILYCKMKGSTNNLAEMFKSDVKLRIAWSYNLGKCVDATPTCIVYTGRRLAVVGSHSGKLAALGLESGEVFWEIQLPDRIESSISPTYCGRQGLIGCYDGFVYCINLNSGQTLWSFKSAAMVKGTAAATDDSWIVGSYDYFVYCLSIQYGQLKWKQKMDGIVLATPLYLAQHSLVVVASLAGQLAALDNSSGGIRWSISLASPIFSSPCIVKDMVVVAEVEGTLHGIQILSGTKVWQYQVGSKIFSSLVTVGDSVVFGCHDSSVHRVNVHISCQLWRCPAGSPVYATPSLLSPHHLISASTAGLVTVVDVTTGTALCSTQLPGEVFSSPVSCENYVVTGCRDDKVYCFEINKM